MWNFKRFKSSRGLGANNGSFNDGQQRDKNVDEKISQQTIIQKLQHLCFTVVVVVIH